MDEAAHEDTDRSEAAGADIAKAEAAGDGSCKAEVGKDTSKPGVLFGKFSSWLVWRNCGRQGEQDSLEGKEGWWWLGHLRVVMGYRLITNILYS